MTDDELDTLLAALLGDPAERACMGAAGGASVDSSRGALAKLLALIEPLLPPQEIAPSASDERTPPGKTRDFPGTPGGA